MTNWRMVVQRLIKSEMTLKGIKYQELSEKLAEIGVTQTADNLRNKVNKGILGADLLVQLMFVMDVKRVERDRIKEIIKNLQ